MAKSVVTAKGKKLDMRALKLKNENTIALGNMKVNAKGDQFGTDGTVISTKNQKAAEHYKLHSAIPVNAPVTNQTVPATVHQQTQVTRPTGKKGA